MSEVRPSPPAPEPAARRRSGLEFLPIVIFLLLGVGLYFGLSGNPNRVPSMLVGKSAGTFVLQPIEGVATPLFTPHNLSQGKVTLVNVWASWCEPCRAEMPLLGELAKQPDLVIAGLNYQDKTGQARAFLNNFGNPFALLGADPDGRAVFHWGVYGVPETFVVDGTGIVRFRYVGEITPEVLEGDLGGAIAAARKGQNYTPPKP